jgi:hypothetical protein
MPTRVMTARLLGRDGMTTIEPAFCARCNDLRPAGDACPKCKGRLQSLDSAKRRGWASLVAAIFLIVAMGLLWGYVANLFGAHPAIDVGAARFVGSVYVAFALVLICGVLGIFNALGQIRTGRRNRTLGFVILVLFAAALITAVLGNNSYHPSGV